MSALEPPPRTGYFTWISTRPDQIYAYLLAVYRLSRLRIVVKTSTGYRTYGLKDASENAVIEIDVT